MNFRQAAVLLSFLALAPSAFAASTSNLDGLKFLSPGTIIAGPQKAVLTIEEYADFECPYCSRGPALIEQSLADYPGKINFIFRNMPLSRIHSHALEAAKAFSAVMIQSPSLAYVYQNELFKNQAQLESKGETLLFDIAQKLGIDLVKMKADMNGPEVAKILGDDEAAVKAHHFQGTPSFVIGTKSISGAYPYADFKKIIDQQL